MLWMLGIASVVCGGFGGYVATVKGRSVVEGLIFGLFLGPFGVVALASLPAGQVAREEPAEEEPLVDIDQWDMSQVLAGPHDARMPKVRT